MSFYLEPVVGICRFSFCGRGDWAAYRDVKDDAALEQVMKAKAAELYDDARMALRFHLFENLLVPSLLAQADQNFVFVVLTSEIMPKAHLDRLKRILAPLGGRSELIVSSETTVHAALMPTLNRLNAGLSMPLPQFRIDDDDCLSVDFIREMRRYFTRLGDQEPLAYSRAGGLIATSYKVDGEVRLYRTSLPLAGVCVAVRATGDRTIFSFGHSSVLRRFPAMIDNGGIGHLVTRIDGHDSVQLHSTDLSQRAGHKLLDKDEAEVALRKWFPYVGKTKGSHLAAFKALMQRSTEMA